MFKYTKSAHFELTVAIHHQAPEVLSTFDFFSLLLQSFMWKLSTPFQSEIFLNLHSIQESININIQHI